MDGCFYRLQESLGAAIDELVTVADGQCFLMGVPGKEGCAICSIVVKISLHGVGISF